MSVELNKRSLVRAVDNRVEVRLVHDLDLGLILVHINNQMNGRWHEHEAN